MAKEEKKEIVNEIKEKLKKAKSVVLTDYRGLSVRDISELRNQLREKNIDYKVYKNTLIRLAVKSTDLEDLNPYLVGPTAIAFDDVDEINVSKVLSDFGKEHKALEIKAGFLEGKIIPSDQIKRLASLPSKEQLISMFMSGMVGPVRNLLGVLNEPVRGFAAAIKQIAESRH